MLKGYACVTRDYNLKILGLVVLISYPDFTPVLAMGDLATKCSQVM